MGVRLLIGILVILLLTGCSRGTIETTPASTTTAQPTISTTPITTTPITTTSLPPTAVALDILSHSSYIKYASYWSLYSGSQSGEFFHIIGELQNPTSENMKLDEDKIDVIFYDAGGSIIDTNSVLKYDFAEEEIIPPGGKWPFRLVLMDEEASKKVASYELLAKGHSTNRMPYQAEVLDYGLFQNANLKLVGEVKNTTSENVNIRLIATFYDEKGRVISVKGFFAPIALAPGEKAPFWLVPIPTEAPGNIEGCELITRCEISDTVPYREFEVFNVVFQKGPEWSWDAITGEVRNIGQQSATYVFVYAAFYDAEGKIIDYGISGVEPETLEPGEIGSFELVTPSPPWQMPNYALLVKASPS